MDNTLKKGIWIDGKNAIIVKLQNNEEQLEKISSEIEFRERFDGEGNQVTRMGRQYFTDEKTKDEKLKHQFKNYFDAVIDNIKDADSIHVFGPAETKINLQKELLKHPQVNARVKKVEPADSMTDKQFIALVKDSFK
jgi:hypothetical protein